jgi:hypothetical protein
VVNESFNDKSDIDLAVRGISDDKFFYAIGRLDCELDHKIDLINLDKETFFNKYISDKAGLIKIA